MPGRQSSPVLRVLPDLLVMHTSAQGFGLRGGFRGFKGQNKLPEASSAGLRVASQTTAVLRKIPQTQRGRTREGHQKPYLTSPKGDEFCSFQNLKKCHQRIRSSDL